MLKKIEILLVLLFLGSFGMKTFRIPGGAAIFILSGMGICLLYNFFSFIILNNIRLRSAFNQNSYSHTNVAQIVTSIFWGFSVSGVLIGFVFKIMHWPGGKIMIISGLIFAIITTIISIFINSSKKSNIQNTELLDNDFINNEKHILNSNFRNNLLIRSIPIVIIASLQLLNVL